MESAPRPALEMVREGPGAWQPLYRSLDCRKRPGGGSPCGRGDAGPDLCAPQMGAWLSIPALGGSSQGVPAPLCLVSQSSSSAGNAPFLTARQTPLGFRMSPSPALLGGGHAAPCPGWGGQREDCSLEPHPPSSSRTRTTLTERCPPRPHVILPQEEHSPPWSPARGLLRPWIGSSQP